jgi:hypothetical protein
MFQRLIRCPIQFFDLNPIGMLDLLPKEFQIDLYFLYELGRILNRFTKDIATMDDNLPLTMFDFLYVRKAIF